MTTCRLLCALLVPALCCCPSVCAVEPTQHTQVKAGETPTPQDSVGSNDSDNTRAKDTELNGQSSDKEVDSSERPSKTVSASATPSPTGTGEEGPSRVPALQDGRGASAQPGASEGNNLSPGSTGDSDKSDVNPEHNKEVALTGKEVKEQAPTTTTTTTTTTKTPTTTTEAPTTTTSRAPSRLREFDGSLSSSAWVCAPLLLAVSALAYTTLG
ncbi:mucin TcMUCII [Trypanosoma cruzi Dm28c]|uniref:Mucin TcMUCII n=1 Tax=Trypanosoma cruzi Dm28c TaxID=1416333 RepID=V5AN33_TRYCR|nr:mucin TcMUCII [Trypanosoma cruzi Dm28c]